MKKRNILCALLAVLMLSGCFKDVTYKTRYVLKPLVQLASGDQTTLLTDAKAYAFGVDTANYAVASYDDALAGVLTSRSNPAEKLSDPAAVGEYDAETGWLQMTLHKTSQLVVVVDPTNKLYAFTQQAIVENFPSLYVSLIFKPWKQQTSYIEGNWTFRNDFYVEPTYLDCYISPSSQAAEGGETAAISNLKAYAYNVDTTAWYVASYDNAVAGTITSKSDSVTTRTVPSFEAYKESDGRYKMSVSSQTLMVVVADRVNRRYAYSKQTVDLTAATSPDFAIVFPLWINEWIYVNTDGWRIVNPELAPKTE